MGENLARREGKDGFIQVTGKPGLGIELNADVVHAHLAPGETWWG